MNCPNCKGSGKLFTKEDIIKIFCGGKYPLYKNVEIQNYPNESILIKFGVHTTNKGGENGDMFTDVELDKCKQAGYILASVGKTYLYLHKAV